MTLIIKKESKINLYLIRILTEYNIYEDKYFNYQK